MSSFLCFLCHSTVNVDTSDDIREKYRDIVGIHLCPDSQLCTICCQVVNKLCQFKTLCLKRSMEYPVLFSEKLFMNLQKSETELYTVCSEDSCKDNLYQFNTKTTNYNFIHNDLYSIQDYIPNNECNSNSYVKLDDRDRNIHTEAIERDNEMVDYDHYSNFDENQEYDPHFNYTNNVYDEPSPINQTDCQSVGDIQEMNDNYVNIARENEIDDNRDQIVTENDFDTGNNDDTNQVVENDSFNDIDNELINDDVTNRIVETDNFNDIDNEMINDTEFDMTISKDTSNSQSISDRIELNETENQNDTNNKRSRKHSKKRFEKIILSFKEQKTALENQRKQKKYIEADFKCYRCALGFRFKDTYQSHMMRHEESNGQFSCTVCGLRFASQNAKCMHNILHSELFKCGVCSMTVKRTHRARHKRGCWGTGDGQVACHMCARSFGDANCLQQHLKRFHTDKTSKRIYSCNVCGQTFKEQSAVRNHMVKHINRRFPCEKCTKTFSSPYTLNQHLKSHLPPSAPGVMLQCTVCGTSYSTLKSLRAHLKNTATHCNDSLECQRCGRVFANTRGLTRHLSRHAARDRRDGGGRRDACDGGTIRDACDGGTIRDGGDSRAKPRVGPTGGHLCDFCGKTYSAKSKLSRHLKEVCGRIRLEEEMTALYEEAANNLEC